MGIASDCRARVWPPPGLVGQLFGDTEARPASMRVAGGYGKTTLARQWMGDRTHAWLQGGAAYADIAALAAGVSTSLIPILGRENRAIAGAEFSDSAAADLIHHPDAGTVERNALRALADGEGSQVHAVADSQLRDVAAAVVCYPHVAAIKCNCLGDTPHRELSAGLVCGVPPQKRDT